MGNSRFALNWLPYVAGQFGIFLVNNSLFTLLIYRYDPGLPNSHDLPFLVPSGLVGVAMLFSRIFGAVSKPKIGYVADRFWSRWGKRRPFIAAGALPLIASFMLLFVPPFGYSSLGILVYLIALLCLFSIAMAIYQVPYLAWLPTLANTAEQRVNISTLMAVLGLLGGAIGGIAAPLLVHKYGFTGMAIAIGILGFLSLIMPLTVTEEFTPEVRQSEPFIRALKSGWKNQSFRVYITGIASAWIAVSMLLACAPFLAVALLNREISFGGVINGVVVGGAIAGLLLAIPLTRRWGKGQTFQFSMAWFGCGLLAIGIWPFLAGTALWPWLILLLLSNLGLAGFFSLPNAMLPDVIDRGETLLGVRQEAIYFGTRGLAVQLSQGVGSLLAAIALMLGKTSAQPWGVQLAFPVAGLFALAAARAFAFYPIKK